VVVGLTTQHMKQAVARSATDGGNLRTDSYTARLVGDLPRGDQTPSIALPGLSAPSSAPPESASASATDDKSGAPAAAGSRRIARRRTAVERLVLARRYLSRGRTQQALVHLPVAATVGDASPATCRQIIEAYEEVLTRLPTRMRTPEVQKELETRLAGLRLRLDQGLHSTGPRGPGNIW
jgi:hypothetical protein